MTTRPHLPDIQSAHRATVILWVHHYASEMGKKFGVDQWDEDYGTLVPAEKNARQFIDNLIKACDELQFSPQEKHELLGYLADVKGMPDILVDISIDEQDKLIASSPVLAKRQQDLQSEYAHLITPQLR